MQKRQILVLLVLIFVVVMPVSATIFSIDDDTAKILIKTISDKGEVSKDAVKEKDLKTDVLQTVKIELSKDIKIDIKTLQLYPDSTVLFSSDFSGKTDVMQKSTKEGYPLIEVYYGYQKSRLEPWQYYFRIEKIDMDNAYVIYADFSKKSVWLGSIPRIIYDTIISSGKIPEWKSINVGG